MMLICCYPAGNQEAKVKRGRAFACKINAPLKDYKNV